MIEIDKEELQEQRVQASKHKESVVQNRPDVLGNVVLGNVLLNYFLFFYCSAKIFFFSGSWLLISIVRVAFKRLQGKFFP